MRWPKKRIQHFTETHHKTPNEKRNPLVHTLLPAAMRSSLEGKGKVSAAAVIASTPAMCDEAAVVVAEEEERESEKQTSNQR